MAKHSLLQLAAFKVAWRITTSQRSQEKQQQHLPLFSLPPHPPMMIENHKIMCVRKASVKMHATCLSLLVMLNVIKCNETEHEIDICKALGLLRSKVQHILKNTDKSRNTD